MPKLFRILSTIFVAVISLLAGCSQDFESVEYNSDRHNPEYIRFINAYEKTDAPRKIIDDEYYPLVRVEER